MEYLLVIRKASCAKRMPRWAAHEQKWLKGDAFQVRLDARSQSYWGCDLQWSSTCPPPEHVTIDGAAYAMRERFLRFQRFFFLSVKGHACRRSRESNAYLARGGRSRRALATPTLPLCCKVACAHERSCEWAVDFIGIVVCREPVLGANKGGKPCPRKSKCPTFKQAT
ncbi:MAG: hypothetical protein JWR21_4380 [Herminiimonas sp.]|nr:hypothetical protein [Herminiimonas sp.]